MRTRRTITLILTLLLVSTLAGTAFGAYLTYKSYVEIYGDIHPLGEVEIDIKQMPPIEGLEAREDYLGQIHAWTYSNDTELILQLAQLSQIVTNFFEFTVKICQPLDMIFVIDITESMGPYMGAVKENLAEIVNILSLTYKAPLRFGAVSFRDYSGETSSLALTNNYVAVKEFIDDLTVFHSIPIPEGHCWGLKAAKDEFDANSAIEIEKVILFISDAEAGFNNAPSFTEAKKEADALAERAIKINSVLCGPDETPENEQLQYYANITGGQYIGPEGQNSIFDAITGHPTWIVKLTPITPFDSFHLKLNSSTPCQKEEYYIFYVYVSFYANAVKTHERFYIELMANLEKSQPFYYPAIYTPKEKMHLIVRGMDNQIYYNVWDCEKESWDGWIFLPTGATNDAPAATVCCNKLHITVRGMTGGIWYGFVDLSTGDFSDWSLLPGDTPSAPTLTSNRTTCFLVVRGMDDRIYYMNRMCDSNWGSWKYLPSGTTLDRPAAAILENNLHIVVRGMDGASLWHGIVNLSSEAFSGWTRIPGATPSAPELAASTTNLFLVVRGMDDRIYYSNWTSGAGWAGWTSLLGATNDVPAAAVCCGKLQIVVIGLDGGLWHGYIELSTGRFSSWSSLPGSTPSAPELSARATR